MSAVGCAHPSRDRGQAAQTGTSHQSSDAVSSDLPTGDPQRRVNPRRSVAPPTLGMDSTDVVQNRSVLDTAPALWPTPPGIVSTDRDPEHRADGTNGPEVAMLIRCPQAIAKQSAERVRTRMSSGGRSEDERGFF